MNGDGRMDFNEFSIACKLINLKLKGMELPKSLPPQVSPFFICWRGWNYPQLVSPLSWICWSRWNCPKSLPLLVSPLSLHAEEMILPKNGFHKSVLFYLLKEMELPKSHHPPVSPLYFTCWRGWTKSLPLLVILYCSVLFILPAEGDRPSPFLHCSIPLLFTAQFEGDGMA